MTIKRGILAGICMLSIFGNLPIVGPAFAGPLEDADVALKNKDYATAVRLIRPLAESGDAVAETNLGAMYIDGRGVPKDVSHAVVWLHKAAQQGNAEAQFKLGLIYVMSIGGVPRDTTQGLAWLRKAAGGARGCKEPDVVG
jgi:TPR repeat protein